MTAEARTVTLDASAVLAYLLREKGGQLIEKLLPKAVIPASAMVETLYRAAEKGYGISSNQLHDDLLALGLTVEPMTDADTVRAAELIFLSKKEPSPGSLSLGDGLCIAVAERLGLTLTGGDKYWATVDCTVTYLPFR